MHKLSISVCDHILNNEECYELIDNAEDAVHCEYDRRIHKFICKLTSEFECYLIKTKGRQRDRVAYKEFTSDVSREITLMPVTYRYPNLERYQLAFPELNIFYFEGFDFTHNVFSLGEVNVSKLRAAMTSAGVFPIYPRT